MNKQYDNIYTKKIKILTNTNINFTLLGRGNKSKSNINFKN